MDVAIHRIIPVYADSHIQLWASCIIQKVTAKNQRIKYAWTPREGRVQGGEVPYCGRCPDTYDGLRCEKSENHPGNHQTRRGDTFHVWGASFLSNKDLHGS